MRRWYGRFLGLLGVALVIFFLGYLAYTGLTEVRPDFGGRYVEGVAGGPMVLSPLLAHFNDADLDVTSLIFASLTRLGPDGQVFPEMAERWEITNEGKTYTFRLRENLRWHDGVPFTADDVVFTFGIVRHKDFPGSRDLARFWKDITVAKSDDLTVEFTLPQRFAPFPSFATLGLVPFHLLRDIPVKDLATAEFNSHPVGTGPFRLVDAFVDHLVLRASADYALGQPYINEVELRFFHDDQVVLSALMEGRLDGALLRPGLPADQLDRLQQDGARQVLQPLRTSYTAVFLNAGFPLFQDKAVRQALMYAVDRAQLVREVLGDQGRVADSPLSQDTWAHASDLPAYSFDPGKAVNLLEGAGWRSSGQGVRQKDGKELRFALVTNDDPTRIKVGEFVASAWRRIGVQVDLASIPPTGLLQNFLIPRRYEAVLYGLDTGYDPDAYSVWHSSQRGEAGLNIAAYVSKTTDTLLEQARQAPDREARLRLYRDFQLTFLDELPSLPLYQPRYTYVVRKQLQGMTPGALFETSSRFVNIHEWFVETKRVWKGQ